ncbi:Uncharacterised protein [Salmonella enterica subsp. enterica serovar Typhi]|nr:Uncharacterised protein [Salmonella enterica subsp. enterica serovar Typhi]
MSDHMRAMAAANFQYPGQPLTKNKKRFSLRSVFSRQAGKPVATIHQPQRRLR